MAGPKGPAERLRQAARLHMGLEARGVHLGHFGQKEHIRPGFEAEGLVPFQVPGVLGEVLVGGELGGVHEEGHHRHIAAGGALPHECGVAFVQVAHGGDESDPFALVPEGLQEGAEIGDTPHETHGQAGTSWD